MGFTPAACFAACEGGQIDTSAEPSEEADDDDEDEPSTGLPGRAKPSLARSLTLLLAPCGPVCTNIYLRLYCW